MRRAPALEVVVELLRSTVRERAEDADRHLLARLLDDQVYALLEVPDEVGQKLRW
jgi:hypothetical protein